MNVESKIQLTYWWLNSKKFNVFFLPLLFQISQINHATTLVWFFFNMCTFSYGHLFLVAIYYQLTSEKNQVHTGDLTHCRQTLQLIKFYQIKPWIEEIGQRNSSFPFLSILWSFFLYHMVKFTVSLNSLSSCDLFVCFPYNLNYHYQQMQGAYEMCTVTKYIM